MKASTPTGQLVPLEGCYIKIPKLLSDPIIMDILPDIGDNKGAQYADEQGIGRTMPFKTYQNSDTRTISWTMHMLVTQRSDFAKYRKYIRALQAAVYPMDGGTPYAPPPICRIKCYGLLEEELCCIMKSYSIKYDTTVPWDEIEGLPYKMDIDLNFEVVYNQSQLPGAEKIFQFGV